MSGVQMVAVTADEAELRIDRWFRRHFPELSHVRLEKLLRTGQVRVDGGRVKSGHRLAAGMTVRVPPFESGADLAPSRPVTPRKLTDRDVSALQELVIYQDRDMLAINKPAGLAVQGGTNTVKHLDGMLDALRFDVTDRPRLVHRLDKDTSGVLLLARHAKSAAALAAAFRDKAARKLYWALVSGVPRPHRGRIDYAVAKGMTGHIEKMQPDDEDGKPAVTYYAVVEPAAQKAAWLALMPLTGRTHQLRVHCAAIGTPIVGDGKYGGEKAILSGLPDARKLHLHAREITLALPGRRSVTVTAPLPPHMAASWSFFGFPATPDGDPFADLSLD